MLFISYRDPEFQLVAEHKWRIPVIKPRQADCREIMSTNKIALSTHALLDLPESLIAPLSMFADRIMFD